MDIKNLLLVPLLFCGFMKKIGSGTRPHGRLKDSLILTRKHEMNESTNKQTNTVNEQII